MTENILRSRRSTAVATTPNAAELETRMTHANAIAQAKSAIPAAYQNNPGAVLLAQEWATNRGVDLLTTMQTVAFIGGKPIVDATMQRALAMRAGYEVTLEVGDKSATCTVSRDGKAVGSSTYTMADAEVAGLVGKDNWKKNPKAMLVARATAQTMRWHAPDVMVGVFTEDEIEEPLEVLSTLNPEPVVEVEGQLSIVDAEVVEPVEDAPCTAETWARVAALKSLPPTIAGDLKAWLSAKGWTFTKAGLTESQSLQVIDWAERRS